MNKKQFNNSKDLTLLGEIDVHALRMCEIYLKQQLGEENIEFGNLTVTWLGDDPYKWSASVGYKLFGLDTINFKQDYERNLTISYYPLSSASTVQKIKLKLVNDQKVENTIWAIVNKMLKAASQLGPKSFKLPCQTCGVDFHGVLFRSFDIMPEVHCVAPLCNSCYKVKKDELKGRTND